MKRKIIEINEEKCNGCGLCITACHEGALAMVDGKARLISESYCDGLGDCLPECPTDAIKIIERDADPFVAPAPGSLADLKLKAEQMRNKEAVPSGCPGSRARVMPQQTQAKPASTVSQTNESVVQSELRQWPVQIKLAPISAPFFDDAHLLIAADCAAFARASFHQDFMKNKVTLIGCPKLDAVDYSEKLAEIIRRNNLKSITVVRMEVPCCGGLDYAVRQAMMQAEKMIPWQVVTVGTDGSILED